MKDLFKLYSNLISVVMPTLRQIELALNDKQMSPKSRLMAARCILFNSDAEFQRNVQEYYDKHIYEIIEEEKLSNSTQKLVFLSFNFDGLMCLN